MFKGLFKKKKEEDKVENKTELPEFNYLCLTDYNLEQRLSIYELIIQRNEGIRHSCNNESNWWCEDWKNSYGLINLYYNNERKCWCVRSDNEIELQKILGRSKGVKVNLKEFLEIYRYPCTVKF